MALRRLALPPRPSGDAATPSPQEAKATKVRIAEIRRQVRELLTVLSERVEATLAPALEQARKAWDQADNIRIIDYAVDGRLARVRRLLDGSLTAPDPAVRAVAVEAIMTLRAACTLVDLLERRLPPLIRLRTRAADPSLLPNDRPFLDLAPALAEAAQGWR